MSVADCKKVVVVVVVVVDSTTLYAFTLNVAINARKEVKQIDIRIIIILLKCSRVVAP